MTSCTIPSHYESILSVHLLRDSDCASICLREIIDRPTLVHRVVRLPLDHLYLLHHWGTRALRVGTLFLGLLIARALDRLFGTRLGPYPRYVHDGEVIW